MNFDQKKSAVTTDIAITADLESEMAVVECPGLLGVLSVRTGFLVGNDSQRRLALVSDAVGLASRGLGLQS